MAQSFTTTYFNYDVFLSFRGEDTRYNFIGNLYHAFCRRGINTFLDDHNLRVGDEISPSLLKVIEESRISIIVLSENYAYSTWCLDELVKILECMEKNKQLAWPIFYKVDPSDLRHQKNSYNRAMSTHEIRLGKDSEKVLNWRSALTKVANLKGDHFKTGNEYEYDFIDKIVKKVSTRLPPKGLHVGEDVVGLEPRLEEVISLLDILSHGTVCMLGIHGIGGIGKTTLAKTLYNSIVRQFEYASFLFDVRESSKQYKGLVSLQETLLSKMLGVEDIKLSSVDEGAFVIKNRLCNRRVLLVLDDVDCVEQLESLAGECNWFGSGSRIIMTTRDKHLLHAHRVEKTYEMEELNVHHASELFSWKAFNSSQPPKKFVGLSNKVLSYASGLPLALRVIGANLFGKDLDECECALDQYKRIPNNNIQGILRISYDGLEDNQKEIFLDIACFFKGYSLEDVKNTLDACDFGPKYHIGVLIDKSLITVDKYGNLQMHDLIQDMGREVTREAAPKELGKRSRLWFDEDVIKVLQENLGTIKIEGIMLNSHQQRVQWNGTAFKKMKNLRILIVRNTCFSVGPKYLPNNLRFLQWEECPLSSLPSSFDPKKLVILKMPYSYLEQEKSLEKFKYVSVIDFSCSQFITEVPDMSGCTVLRKLDLSNCKNLIKVRDSVGFLTKVTHLDLQYCKNLSSLPSEIQMTSLEKLDITGCTSLEHFPEILGNMDCLLEIYATDTGVKELPNSICNLTGLEVLILSGSNLVSIPASIKNLSNLRYLCMQDCMKLQEIYEIPSNLWETHVAGCTSLTSQSASVLWSQAIKGGSRLSIVMPEAQIPDWFDHCCEGGLLSFWARRKLPDAAFACILNIPANMFGKLYVYFKVLIFVNGVEANNFSWFYVAFAGCHAYLQDLHRLLGREADLERYLVHEWNYVEIKVTKMPEGPDITVHHCGLYVYKQGTSMEDVRFESPYSTMSISVVPRNALKRGGTSHRDNEPLKKLSRKPKPRDYRGKFRNARTKKRTTYHRMLSSDSRMKRTMIPVGKRFFWRFFHM